MIDLGRQHWPFFVKQSQSLLEHATGSRRLAILQELKANLAAEENRLRGEQPCVFIGMPLHDAWGCHQAAFNALSLWPSDRQGVRILQSQATNSLLARGFNLLWAEAIGRKQNEGVTHFAMLHGDVVPERNWLDIMLSEMERTGCDVLSCVVPIKSHLGLTSTAIDQPGLPWAPRRLTKKEIMRLPETFDGEDCREAGIDPGSGLLLNTGCMLVDLSKPWVGQFSDDGSMAVHFTINDRIERDANGRLSVMVEPEDWYFSRAVRRTSPEAKLLATRKVATTHKGETDYPNNQSWGLWDRDEEAMIEADRANEPAAAVSEGDEV